MSIIKIMTEKDIPNMVKKLVAYFALWPGLIYANLNKKMDVSELREL